MCKGKHLIQKRLNGNIIKKGGRTMNKENKVVVKLSGEDGNVFSIIGRVGSALKRAGKVDLAKEYQAKALSSGSYDEVLCLSMDYVDVR